MKRTELQRKEREIKKKQKQEERLDRKSTKEDRTIGDFINSLASYFFHDETKIYNIQIDERIHELVLEMQMELAEEEWDTVFRKAVRKTKIKERDAAFDELKGLLT